MHVNRHTCTCKHARMHATKQIRKFVIRLHANKEDAHNYFANFSALLATLPPLAPSSLGSCEDLVV